MDYLSISSSSVSSCIDHSGSSSRSTIKANVSGTAEENIKILLIHNNSDIIIFQNLSTYLSFV